MKKLFIIATTLGLLFTACGGSSTTNSRATSGFESDLNVSLQNATLVVQGLCDMCKNTIENTAMNAGNLKSAKWDPQSKVLELTSTSPIEVATISKALGAVGYDTDLDKAGDSVYDALPACCQYR